MKAIDTHTHLPGALLGGPPRSAKDLRREFEADGLAGAWIMTVDGLLGDPAPHNDVLAREVRGDLDFFVPFCTVWPHLGLDACLRELDRCATKLHMRGVKLHPWLQAFSLSHPAMAPILRRAGELGMPVVFHDGTPPYSTPMQIARAAEQAPRTTIVLGHSGLDDLYRDASLACLRHPNVWLCLCSLSAGNIAEVVSRCPKDRLLFGSDGGFRAFLPRAAMAKFTDLGLSDADAKAIFRDNALRLIPLPQKPAQK